MHTMRLQLVPLPVADVDRAKAFYTDQLGFTADHDVQPGGGVRVCQLTPPGSACSVLLSAGLPTLAEQTPGAVRGLHLVVDDIRALHALLLARGVAVSEVNDVGGGILMAGFSDPDGNTWLLQQVAG